MLREKIIFPIILLSIVVFTSCNQEAALNDQAEIMAEKAETQAATAKEQHPYGGWYCPDNFGGFPPMDIQDLAQVPVVMDRLPTKEETRDGRSLMYFDPEETPDARPLEMKLPRVARIYSRHNGIHELIIVIQAAVIGEDTVLGFRYPNGGNGSAWFGEVSFLSDQEVDEIGPSPFVYVQSDIQASKEEIWKAVSRTAYAQKLGERFDKNAFFESDWTDQSTSHLSYESDSLKASGIVTSLWGNLYIQVDYDYGNFHFSEKMLVLENREDNTAQLHMVAGPYPEDFEAQTVVWTNWLQEVKASSEGK